VFLYNTIEYHMKVANKFVFKGNLTVPVKPAQLDQTLERPKDFESALAALEALVAKMESGDLTLEASLLAYEQGVALSKICQEQLSQAEQQVRMLEADLLKPFSGDNSTISG
jgi:exodeoxyribonuclease VII small subunit